MAEATLTLTDQGLYVITHEGVEYGGTNNGAIVGALVWLLEPEYINLRGSNADNFRELRAAHSIASYIANDITASLAPNLQPPLERWVLEALLLSACALGPPPHYDRLMRRTADALDCDKLH